MAKKYLDYDGLLYFWQKIKTLFVSDVTYNSTSKKIQKTKNGTTSDVVTLATVATSGSYSDLSSKPTIPSAGTGSSYPAMDGTRALGSNAGFARVDHVHPTDTSRAPLASPDFTGTPTAPTASTGTSTTQIATTEFVANTVGAMTSGVSDVQVDNTSVVTSGVAHIDTFEVATADSAGAKGLVPAPPIAGDPPQHFKVLTGLYGWQWLLLDTYTPSSGESSGKIHLRLNSKAPGGNTTNKSISVQLPEATTSANGLMSISDKTKLNGIDSGAEVNQNAFSNVKVGSTTVAADSKTDTLELVAGTDISLTPDATNDKVTIAFNGTIPSSADEIEFVDSGQVWQGYDQVTDVEGALVAVGSEFQDIESSLSSFVSTTQVGAANGVAPLNASSKIDSTYLPSYVDDVVEAYPRTGQTELSSTWLATTSASGTVITPEAGKIYILMSDSTSYSANSQFRWGGSAYVKMNDGGVSSITNAEIDTIVAS